MTSFWTHSALNYSVYLNLIYELPLCNFYTPRNEVRGGILESPCLSVCLSVRPSVRLSVDARLGKMVSSA